MAAKFLVIVESPAKCKTISKFLGKDYELTASYGHVRDLPNRKLGIDIKNSFEPTYTSLKDKSKIIKSITSASKKSELVYIATDPDREGEAIAWHIVQAAKLPDTKIRRIVFNEITESAIKQAIQSSRDIDMDLVNAQQARRVLDRLIGYKLSPVLSSKIQRGLSAGRVQSVAVKIICDREKEILAFVPEEYWNIETTLSPKDDKISFQARLAGIDSIKNKCKVTNEADATSIKSDLESSQYTVDNVVKSRVKRHPAPPFITSTLQQDASRKLNWSAKKTMIVAQQLYEGVTIEGDSVGLITYMRTDSTRISEDATNSARNYIESTFSKKYLAQKKQASKSKKNIQDAHEAIRPVYIEHSPDKIESYLSSDHYKLYKLIWDRFLASNMTPAEFDRTQVVIKAAANTKNYFLRASGSIMVFDGFMRLYIESQDEPAKEDEKDNKLPLLTEGDACLLKDVSTEQKFTQPPPRFTEASLVKELEEQGIGRPSTYAPTISTIQDRGYIQKEQKRLSPSELGMVVTDQLESYFKPIIDLKFTASMETQLDDIQEGKYEWHSIIESYYTPLADMIQTAYKEMDRISLGERELGIDPKTKRTVFVKIGRYGPMAQIGHVDDEDKPLFAALHDDQDIKTVELKDVLKLFELPREIGNFEEKEVIVNRGKFGPYVKYSGGFVSIPKEIDPYTITLDQAIELIHEKKQKDKEKTIQCFDEEEPIIYILNGPYGPYISSDKKNYRIPKSTEPASLTRQDCLDIMKNSKHKKKKKK